jgi:hypothetical protein
MHLPTHFLLPGASHERCEHVYDSPQVMTAKKVPPKVARYLDGTDLLAKTQALRLSTVDAALAARGTAQRR